MRVALGVIAVSFLLAAPLSAATPAKPMPVVPHGQTYVFYKDGKVVSTVNAGKRWHELVVRNYRADDGEVNCIEIQCPGGLPNGAHCWRCTG